MRYFRLLALASLALAGVVRAGPIDAIYVGPPGTFDESPTNYTIADNWSPAGVPNDVPNSPYNVTIPKDVFVDIPIAITSLTIDIGGSLTVKDTPTAADLFTVASSFTNSSTLTVHNSSFESHGVFTNFDSATGTLSGGTFIVEGFDLSASATRSAVFEFINANIAINQSSITLINHAMIVDQLARDGLRNFLSNTAQGSFVVGSGYNFTASGTFTNAGTVTVQAAIPDVNGFAIGAGSFSVPSGHQYLQTAGTTTIDGSLTADLSDIQAGTLSLGGVINGIVTVENTTLTPTGQSAPEITGNLTLDTTSTMQFSIPSAATIVNSQFTSSEYDHLMVNGNVTLGNSNLAVQVAAGYPISSHTTFTVLDTAMLGGRLGNVTSGSRLTTLDGLGSFVVSLSNQMLQLTSFQTVPPAAQFANLSTRGEVLTGEDILIGGFIVVGTQPKKILIRVIGPSLSSKGVANPLADPFLELHDATGAIIASNDNWKDTQQFAIESTGIPPTNDLESALVTSLQPGLYTVVVRGNNGGTGTALVEVYDLSPNVDATVSNLSTRGFVDPANPLIGGFIAGVGSGNTETVFRAIGPDLGALGVTNPLSDPTLEVRDADGNLVGSNDDYVPGSDPILAIGNLEPGDSHDSAIRLSLAPGAYTVLVNAKTGEAGTALVELYDLYH